MYTTFFYLKREEDLSFLVDELVCALGEACLRGSTLDTLLGLYRDWDLPPIHRPTGTSHFQLQLQESQLKHPNCIEEITFALSTGTSRLIESVVWHGCSVPQGRYVGV